MNKKFYYSPKLNIDKINFDDINLLIDDIPCISVKHKNFLKLIIKKRFDAYFN